jgi:hypothetical protein
MEWMITVGLAVIFIIALPPAIVAAKKSVRGNGRMAGVALCIGLAVSILYDARKREVIENIGNHETGDEGSQGEDEPEELGGLDKS